jgi:hypothetical protein
MVGGKGWNKAMTDWKVRSARLTFFIAPNASVPSELWKKIAGEEPETSVLLRAQAVKTESGPLAEGVLKVQVQPMRIDCVYESLVEASGNVGSLGPFPQALTPLSSLMERWADSDSFPSTQRVALGVTLYSETSDRASGYRALASFVDGVPTSEDATDFIYQVNRPRPSNVPMDGLVINRLSRWSVAGVQMVALGAGALSWPATPMQTFLQLDLDLSTNADLSISIPSESVVPVIHDLVTAASEISTRGNRF